MSHNISCKCKDGKFKHFKVPFEIWIYIRQLEVYVIDPKLSKLKEHYPHRFNKKILKGIDWGYTQNWDVPENKQTELKMEET